MPGGTFNHGDGEEGKSLVHGDFPNLKHAFWPEPLFPERL